MCGLSLAVSPGFQNFKIINITGRTTKRKHWKERAKFLLSKGSYQAKRKLRQRFDMTSEPAQADKMRNITICQLEVSIPNYLTYTLTVIGIIIIFISIVSNISLHLFIRRQYRNKGNMFFFRIILFISMVNVTIGQPLELINILLITQTWQIDILSNTFLFLSFSAIYHCITCQTIEKYLKINGNALLEKKHRKIIFIICFAMFVISINTPIIINVSHIIIRRQQCETPPPATPTIITMSTWIGYCSLIVSILTRKLIIYVKEYNAFRRSRLSKNEHISIKRLQVMKRLWIAFSILWLPYGIANAIRDLLSTEEYECTNAASRIVAFTSFIALPAAYYATDKRYATYVQSLVRRVISRKINPDKSNQEQSTESHSIQK